MMRAIPLLLVACAVILAWFGDAICRRRQRARDSGHLWAVTTSAICMLGLLDAISASLESLPSVWGSGWHLEIDRAWGTPRGYYLSAAIPFVVWIATLFYGVSRVPPQEHASRWLAGSLGHAGKRAWVLGAAALPAIVVIFGLSRLNTGLAGMSVATWMICALLIVSLVFLAISAGTGTASQPTPAATASPLAAQTLQPWAEGMAAAGIALEPLVTWPAGAPPRRVQTVPASSLGAQLENTLASGVAPELVETVIRLVTEGDAASPRSAVIFAPDDCGQAEVVAHAASELMLSGDEATLVISPVEDEELARRLAAWRLTTSRDEVQRLRPGADVPAEAASIWLVDIQTLSDHFLERLTDARIAGRVGLVVWWDVHRYSGVLAANAWAISRRLQRLMTVAGRPGLRTLVLVRETEHADAQLKPFIQLLLPYQYQPDMMRHVEQGFARSVSIYRLLGHAERFRSGHDALSEKYRHPVLVASEASAGLRWATHVPRPPDVARDEYETVAAQSIDAGTLVSNQLVSASADAGARILHVGDADLLGLQAMVNQGGRALPADRPHHVALTTSGNPFADYVLHRLGDAGPSPFGSRRLVGARGHARIFEHHLLAALREAPDTRGGLRQTFLWNDQVIERTLEALRKGGNLDREEVVYLDHEGTRVIDYRYRSRRSHGPTAHPLDTVGLDLISVRDSSADREQGVRMRVDRERATIQAYPHRVFEWHGERFRIQEWTTDDLRAGSVTCALHEPHERTWRIRSAAVSRITTRPGRTPAVIAGRGDYTLTRTIVDLFYEEGVNGVVRTDLDPETGLQRRRPPIRLVTRKCDAFATSALVLGFDQRGSSPPETTLSTLALALACVLPVMLGVDDDALEVVQLRGRHVARTTSEGLLAATTTLVHGLAIVDLYPDGIGLVDAFEDDPGFVFRVLDVTRQWLHHEAKHDPGRLAKSPLAAAVRVVDPDPARAAEFLDRLLGATAGTLTSKAGR
jgi:hypothetical protein